MLSSFRGETMRRRLAGSLLVVSLVLPACVNRPASSTPIALDTSRIANADREPENWLTHGRTYSEQRFSPLKTVDTTTVGRLGPAWTYELKTPRGASATPVVIDGVMYVTSSWSLVYALDAATGKELWVFDPKVDRATGASACCDVVNRGVAVYEDKVFVGILDGRLAALDARTGRVAWETRTVDPTLPYTITGAPRVANGLVYIGNGGAEYGVRGYVSAYDASTGTLRWRFYTVPGDPAKGPDKAASDSMMPRATEAWNGKWWQWGGGGTVWDAIVYDAEFDQLIVGVGNGSPWNQAIRSPGGGDNLFLSSILALDAKTGAYRWHYQTTPGDTWDFTATQPIVLADLTIAGAPRKVAMQAPKNGFFYVLDRQNGRLISATALFPMFPTKSTPQGMPLSWAHAVDPTTGRPVENPEARYKSGTVIIRPSPFGAHNWHPMSFSPETGLVYIPVQELALDFTTDRNFVTRPGRWNLGTVFAPFPDDPAIRAAIKGASKGYLLAWDAANAREAWRVEHKGPWNGGTLATAGGLVFEGTVDGRFLALDARTGKELWSIDHHVSTLAGPITYSVNGEQYVTALSGFGSVFNLSSAAISPIQPSRVNGRVHTYKIGGTAALPTPPTATAAMGEPPTIDATSQDIARGAALYGQFCMVCHGFGAVGGAIADLRRSARLADAAAWREAVVNGAMAGSGMPRFTGDIGDREAEQIRAYVARQAAALHAQQKQAPRP
jgi:PQQ-dependent dehydrogenase (methanol/ethanol family)